MSQILNLAQDIVILEVTDPKSFKVLLANAFGETLNSEEKEEEKGEKEGKKGGGEWTKKGSEDEVVRLNNMNESCRTHE